jgi:PHS family inorganic phosphate transporter-like MFS transporter
LFQTFGPNSTAFIIPGELFPTRFRATCHGISAAAGKSGAIVALVGFIQLKDIGGNGAFIPYLFIIFAFFMLIGLAATFLLPETMGYSLEVLNSE